MPIENQLHQRSASERDGFREPLKDPLLDVLPESEQKGKAGLGRSLVIGAALFFAIWGIDQGRRAIFSGGNDADSNEIANVVSDIKDDLTSKYDSDLLDAMGARMKEMGYGELSHQELAEWRDKGLTATWLGQIRNLGLEDLTLEDAVRLKDRDVSPTFISMMQGLGYKLSVADIVRLKDAEVKAQYTSQLADLGYKNLTIDELVRLKTAGVTVNLVERMIKDRKGEKPSLEEIIRYRASNQ
jgi:hypothetical protein